MQRTNIKTTSAATRSAKKKPAIRTTDQVFRYPYPVFNPAMMIHSDLVQKDHAKEFNVTYNYGTADAPNIGQLRVDFPHKVTAGKVSEHAQSPSGVRIKKNKKDQESAPPQSGRGGRGGPPPSSSKDKDEEEEIKYRLISKLDPSLESHQDFIELMRQIYVALLKITAKLLPAAANRMPPGPEEEIDAENPGCLRYILLYGYDPKTEAFIPGSIPVLDGRITPTGRYATRFIKISQVTTNEAGELEYEYEYLKFADMISRGIEHIPRINISSVSVGAFKVIRVQYTDILITNVLSDGGVSDMGDIVANLAAHGIATENLDALEDLRDLLSDEKSRLEGNPPPPSKSEDVPEDDPEPRQVTKGAGARRPAPAVQPDYQENDGDLGDEPEEQPAVPPAKVRLTNTAASRRTGA